jgi:hypothetical protein
MTNSAGTPSAQYSSTLDLTARKFLRNGVLCEDTKPPVYAGDKSRRVVVFWEAAYIIGMARFSFGY